MYSKRLFLIIGFIALSGISLFFYQSSRSERQLRLQNQEELEKTLVKLSAYETEITALKKKREEAEKKFNQITASLENSLRELEVKNASLEASFKQSEDALKVLTEAKAGAESERDALWNSFVGKLKEIAVLNKKIEGLETDRGKLLEKIGSPAPKVESVTELTYAAPDPKKDGFGKRIHLKTGKNAQVQFVDENDSFVVINAGAHDGLRKGTVLNLVRDNRVVGKVTIRKIKSGWAGATLLPEGDHESIRVGDFVTQF